MRMPQVWLDKHLPPRRNGRDGYEFKGDCGLQTIIVEIGNEVTAGMNETEAQILLNDLRPKIEKAARRRHSQGEAYSESPRPEVERFRIVVLGEDLDAVKD